MINLPEDADKQVLTKFLHSPPPRNNTSSISSSGITNTYTSIMLHNQPLPFSILVAAGPHPSQVELVSTSSLPYIDKGFHDQSSLWCLIHYLGMSSNEYTYDNIPSHCIMILLTSISQHLQFKWLDSSWYDEDPRKILASDPRKPLPV